MNFWKNVVPLAFVSGGGGDLWNPKFLYLNAKNYTHNKRLLDDNNIEFLHFLYVLKFKLDIEDKICKKNNTTQTFKQICILIWPNVISTYTFDKIKLFIINKNKLKN